MSALGDFDRPAEETQPLIRDIVDSTWDDEGSALYLEFVVYAARNPEAREKLAALLERQHEAIAGVIRSEYERRGVAPDYPIDVLATISSALFEGLGVTRLINPELVQRDTVDAVLGFLWNTIGRDALLGELTGLNRRRRGERREHAGDRVAHLVDERAVVGHLVLDDADRRPTTRSSSPARPASARSPRARRRRRSAAATRTTMATGLA